MLFRSGAVAETMAAKLAERFNRIDSANERIERELRNEIKDAGQSSRQELAQNLALFQQANEARLAALQKAVDERLAGFAQDARNGREESANTLKRFGDGLNQQLAEVRATMEARLKDIETQNGVKLDEMRKTVDEKLHATLEQRLGESFKLVSDRLEAVHKGLGEMQTLAMGVGDLDRKSVV